MENVFLINALLVAAIILFSSLTIATFIVLLFIWFKGDKHE